MITSGLLGTLQSRVRRMKFLAVFLPEFAAFIFHFVQLLPLR
jgi:hypothetical protein